jgi:hypothetical protein
MIRIRDEITLKFGYSYEHQEKIFETGNLLLLQEEAKLKEAESEENKKEEKKEALAGS